MAWSSDWISPRLIGRYAVVGGLLALEFGLRLVVDEPGPLFLIPVLLAAWWFGRWAGLGVGLVAGALVVLASGLNSSDSALHPGATAVRVALACGAGFLIGLLIEQRRALRVHSAVQAGELDELHRIQEALSPSEIPTSPALELGFVYEPAQEGVSGDFCLVAQGPAAQTTVVALGDVVGKGLDAAQRASFVRTALAAAVPFTDDPSRLLKLANVALVERAGTSADFVTAICLTYRPTDRSVLWASAGHPRPLRLDDGQVLGNRGGVAPPLGLDREIACTSTRTRLGPGDGLLLFTDGLTEARAPGQPVRLLGAEGVSGLLRELRDASPVELVARLREAASEFAAGTLRDDLCMLALRAKQ